MRWWNARRLARMSGWGQTEKNSVRAYVFRFALELGHARCRRHFAFVPKSEVRQMSFLDPRRAKKKDRLAAVSPSLTDARSSSSLERFPRSLIGAIEGSSRFRQSRHECGP